MARRQQAAVEQTVGLGGAAGLLGDQELEPELRPTRPGDIKDSYADISLARKVLGYRPKVALEDGLREISDSKRDSCRSGINHALEKN